MIGNLRTEVPLGGRYLLHDVIGRGAMGSVHRASVRDEFGPPGYAVKVMRPELASNPAVVARLWQESKVLTGLQDRHLVRVYDLVSDDENLAIVMELVHGADLRSQLGVAGTLPPEEAVELVAQVLQGLSALHAVGMVHSDVRPENILLDLSGQRPVAKLTDFGLSSLAQESLTRPSGLIRTAEFRAPELAADAPPSPSSDIYAAGVLLYELLAGRTPFVSSHPVAVLRRHEDSAPPAIPGLHRELAGMLDRMLAKQPADRPATAAAAASELRALAPKLHDLPAHPALPKGSLVKPNQDTATRVRLESGPDRVGAGETVARLAQPTAAKPAQPGPQSAGNLTRNSVIAGLLVLALAASAGLVWALRPTAQTAAEQLPTSTYAFAPQLREDGLTVTRTWTLSGTDFTDLTEELTVTNSNTSELRSHYDLVIPKEIAAKASAVDFTPAPSKVIAEDPVVRFDLSLNPAESRTITYRTTVDGQGRPEYRLSVWAVAYAEAASRYAVTAGDPQKAVTIRKLAVKPAKLSTTSGQTVKLRLSGKMSDGSAAPKVLLKQAKWRTSDGQVVSVANGRVRAISAGRAMVSAKLGNVSAKVVVNVKPPVVRAPASIRSQSPTLTPSFTLRPPRTSAPTQKPAPKPKATKAPKPTQTKKATSSQAPKAAPTSEAAKTSPTSEAAKTSATSAPQASPTTEVPKTSSTSASVTAAATSTSAKATTSTSAKATRTARPTPTRTATPRRTSTTATAAATKTSAAATKTSASSTATTTSTSSTATTSTSSAATASGS